MKTIWGRADAAPKKTVESKTKIVFSVGKALLDWDKINIFLEKEEETTLLRRSQKLVKNRDDPFTVFPKTIQKPCSTPCRNRVPPPSSSS